MDFNSCRFVSYLVFAVSRKIFLILVIYQILWSQIWIKVAFLFKVDIRKTPENYNFFLPFSLELQISIGLKRWGNFFTLKIMMITFVCFFFQVWISPQTLCRCHGSRRRACCSRCSRYRHWLPELKTGKTSKTHKTS
jgi:hypothetical protein